ncbi:hypothetical protein J1605_022826 [Eschrichtius robustus]|uniref:USP domain-containing protein n=1 Tax=Eschrichtius robustus TaxID=9764 RepID=A0AB34H5Z8_ESCRO|nr:hypothetical protein J1605_022826 [Eschrichtius robustus]
MDKKVLYPGCFDLQPYMSQQEAGPLDYVFYAVLVHSGGSCHRQPYFCYVRAGNGQWYKMDDTKVTTACDVASALSQSAYVLFYVQKSMDAAHGEPGRDTSIRVPGSEEHLGETDVQEITLEQWRCRREHNRPQPESNHRKIESTLPAHAVVIHPSKYGDGMKMKLPEQENYLLNNPARGTAPQGPVHIGHIPCLRGKDRASKKKNENKLRSLAALQ